MKPLLRALRRGAAGIGALSALCLAAPAGAQTAALPAARWEYIAPQEQDERDKPATAIALKPGDSPGAADTLLTSFASREGLRRIALSDIERSIGTLEGVPWATITGQPIYYIVEHVVVTTRGTLLAGSHGGRDFLDRSTDGGRTWAHHVAGDYQPSCLFERPSGRGILACTYEKDTDRSVVIHSTDDGRTWRHLSALPAVLEGNAFAEIARPGGDPDDAGGGLRLVAGIKGGIAVSDDDGRTWRQTSLWQDFRWNVLAFAQAPAGSRSALGTASAAQALGDTLFAAARDFSTGHPTVLASVDGEAWEVRHAFPEFADPRFVIGPDGALWVGTNQRATSRFPTVVWRSGDGGRTWAPVQDGYDAYQGVARLLAGRDGRMYLSGGSGVWRTTAPLVAVASEAPAGAGPEAFGLSVRPNPASGRTEVVLRLAEVSDPARGAQPVRVVVFDVQGREVVVLLDGAAAAGERRLGVDTSGWPAGVYVVRASAGERVASARLVVVR